MDDFCIITSLMIEDIRDKYGEEYDVWAITKGDYNEEIKPETK